MHKWWHFMFISVSQSNEHSTSYCGKYLWHHFSYDMQECSLCKKFHLNLKDHKNGKHVVLNWVDFKEVNQAIKDIRKDS